MQLRNGKVYFLLPDTHFQRVSACPTRIWPVRYHREKKRYQRLKSSDNLYTVRGLKTISSKFKTPDASVHWSRVWATDAMARRVSRSDESTHTRPGGLTWQHERIITDLAVTESLRVEKGTPGSRPVYTSSLGYLFGRKSHVIDVEYVHVNFVPFVLAQDPAPREERHRGCWCRLCEPDYRHEDLEVHVANTWKRRFGNVHIGVRSPGFPCKEGCEGSCILPYGNLLSGECRDRIEGIVTRAEQMLVNNALRETR